MTMKNCHLAKEQALVVRIKRWTENMGGICYNNPPTTIGRPDLEIILYGKVIFIETKKNSGGQIGIEQARQISKLKRNRVPAYFCKSWDEFKEIINEVMGLSIT